MEHTTQPNDPAPFINVTPLIDVLLVLLIIFMVVAPLKPHRFKALIPEPPSDQPLAPAHPDSLVVTVGRDAQLQLNQTGPFGSISDPAPLIARLQDVFRERRAQHHYRFDLAQRPDLPDEARIQRTVFIKAPRSLAYGEVVKVIDSLKSAGAEPVGLQVDALEQ